MTKAIVLACVLLLAGAAVSFSQETAPFAREKTVDAAKKARCERDAMLMLLPGQQKSRWQCLASKEPPGEAVDRQPAVRPTDLTAVPKVAPLGPGSPLSTSTGSTAPSNAPAAPSAPVVGSPARQRPDPVLRP